MPKAVLYKIVNNKTNKIYVGSTCNFVTRKRAHLTDLRKNRHHSSKLQRSFNKYGESCFEFVVIEVIENKENRLKAEQQFIDKYKPFYNIRKNVYDTTEGLKLNSTYKYGEIFKKAITQFDLNGVFIKNWESQSEAAKYLKGYTSAISQCCKGKKKTYKGFIFQYKDNPIPYVLNPCNPEKEFLRKGSFKSKYFEISHSNGMVVFVKNLKTFCNIFNLSYAHMNRSSRKGYKHKGFTVKKIS